MNRALILLALLGSFTRAYGASAAFTVEVYASENGTVGKRLDDVSPVPQLKEGERFFVRILAQEYDPFRYGLGSISLDLSWNPVEMQYVGSTDGNQVVTNDLPLFRHLSDFSRVPQGEIQKLHGMAFISGGAGRAIGNQKFEHFAFLEFQALRPVDLTSLVLSVGKGGVITVPSRVLSDRDIRFEEQRFTITGKNPTRCYVYLQTAFDQSAFALEWVGLDDNQTADLGSLVEVRASFGEAYDLLWWTQDAEGNNLKKSERTYAGQLESRFVFRVTGNGTNTSGACRHKVLLLRQW